MDYEDIQPPPREAVEPARSPRRQKITRQTATPEDYADAAAHRARVYISKKFRECPAGEGPRQERPLEVIGVPVSYLRHMRYEMLYIGTDANGDQILTHQFCDACGIWLSTGNNGFQNGERHCLNSHTGSSPQASTLDKWDVVLFFVRNLLPLRLIEDPVFQSMGTRKQFLKILMKIRKDVDAQVARFLANSHDHVFIEDGWTDALLRPYHGLWAVGNSEADLSRSVCIGQLPLSRANAESTANAIVRRLTKLGFSGDKRLKVDYFVGDRAAVNGAIIDQFNYLTQNRSEPVPCAAHGINSMMQRIWSDIKGRLELLLIVIESVRNKGQFRRMSESYKIGRNPEPQFDATVAQVEPQIRGSVSGKVRHRCPTAIASAVSVRWYSLVRMFSSAIELRPVIEQYLARVDDRKLSKALTEGYRSYLRQLDADPDEVDGLSDDDVIRIFFQMPSDRDSQSQRLIGTIPSEQWKVAGELLEILREFENAMLLLEGDRFGTMAEVWKSWMWLRDRVSQMGVQWLIQAWEDAVPVWSEWENKYPVLPTEKQRTLVLNALTERQRLSRLRGDQVELVRLKQRCAAINKQASLPLYQVAALLRPSNLRAIPNLLKNEKDFAELLSCLGLLYEAVKEELAAKSVSAGDEILSVRAESQREASRFSLMADLGGEEIVEDAEFERYTRLRVGAPDDADLKAWWKANQADFPVFYRLAQLYLIIPATSAGVERMFSKARRVLSRLRMKLTQENAEMFVYLRENIGIVEQLRNSGKRYW